MTLAAGDPQIVLIVQARMRAERLPGKVLLPVLGRPLLGHELDRIRRAKSPGAVVLATTVNPADDPLAEFARKEGVAVFRGPESDVLSRYAQAARAHSAEAVIRITADCPLIDPAVIDRVAGVYLDRAGKADYVSNTLKRTYPRGMDCEIFSATALAEADREARAGFEREHVTPFLYGPPGRFRLESVEYVRDESRHRWTVDTKEDFELARRYLEALLPTHPRFSLEDALALAERHPEWSGINRHVEQKPLSSSKGKS